VSMEPLERSTLLIFRDCLRLIPQMQIQKDHVPHIRKILKNEFIRHKEEKEKEKIASLRANAIRGISNYLLYTIKMQYLNNPKPQTFAPEDEE